MAFMFARSRCPLRRRSSCVFSAASAAVALPWTGHHLWRLPSRSCSVCSGCGSWLRFLRQGESVARHAPSWSFVAGCASYFGTTVGWLSHCVAWHIALSDVPGTAAARPGPGNPASATLGVWQVGLTPSNILAHDSKSIFYQLRQRNCCSLTIAPRCCAEPCCASAADERMLLFLLQAGSLLIVGLLLGHVNEFYLDLSVPLRFSLWFGAWLGELFEYMPVTRLRQMRTSVCRLSFYVLLLRYFSTPASLSRPGTGNLPCAEIQRWATNSGTCEGHERRRARRLTACCRQRTSSSPATRRLLPGHAAAAELRQQLQFHLGPACLLGTLMTLRP